MTDDRPASRFGGYLLVVLLGVAAQACTPASTGPPGDVQGTIVHRTLSHGEYMEAALPITVVGGGAADTEPQPPRAGHIGRTRIEYARQWVEAMTRIAPKGKSRIRLGTVPGIGHSSSGLTPACQRALAESLGEN